MNWMERGSFHYKGRDKRGVHRWTGSWNSALKWIGWPFCIYAGFAALVLVASLLYVSITGTLYPGFAVTIAIAVIHALTFGGVGYWSLWMRSRIQRLSPPDQAAERLGIDQEALRDLALERGIKPRMIINDQDYYDLIDFDPSLILVRGSQEPDTATGSLLRPATHAKTTDPAELLRPDERQINKQF